MLDTYPTQIETNQVDELLSDIVNIYILKMSTLALKELTVNRNSKAALDALVAVRFGCTQFKQPKQLIYQ